MARNGEGELAVNKNKSVSRGMDDVGGPAAALYLDLLKKTLTDTLHAGEPDAAVGGPRFILDFRRHYIQGRAASMLPLIRLDNLQACVEDVLARAVPGDLIETGVWRGGATILMRAILKSYGVVDRHVWVADSFEGLPEPDPVRFPKEAKAHHSPVMQEAFGHLAAGIDEVRANFQRYGLLDEQVRFLPGWFEDTLPAAPIERLSILRLDGDYHDSTMVALQHLYDRVSPGGYIIIDDYGEDDWTYCREAVDTFRRERGITDAMMPVDTKCWYWRRSH